MRTTIEIPQSLIDESMILLNTKTKAETVKKALEEIIKLHKRKKLIQFKGKVDLNIDLDKLRDRV